MFRPEPPNDTYHFAPLQLTKKPYHTFVALRNLTRYLVKALYLISSYIYWQGSNFRMTIASRQQKLIARKLLSTFGKEAQISRTGAPIRRSFVLKTKDGPSPLVRLLNQRDGKSGGPGGRLRLQMYLSLLWVCAGKPYKTTRPARVWAELLGLEDPATNGTRRVRAALKELAERKFVRVEPTKPTPTITVLSDLGDGSPYTNPGEIIGDLAKEDRKSHEYFRVPNVVWTEGFLGDMDGAAIAMFLVLLAESRGVCRDVWISPHALDELYGISASTRTKGVAQLKELGLVTVTRQAVQSRIDFSPSRQIYRVPILPDPIPQAE